MMVRDDLAKFKDKHSALATTISMISECRQRITHQSNIDFGNTNSEMTHNPSRLLWPRHIIVNQS